MIKILLLGASSTVGQEIIEQAKDINYIEIIPIYRKDIGDLSQESVNKLINGCYFDICINCIAIVNINKCEEDKQLAHYVNTQFVSYLALYCRIKKIPLIHLSSVTVYGNLDSNTSNKVGDLCSPKSTYAMNKLESEKYVTLSPLNCVIRTCWLFNNNINNPKFIAQIVKKLLDEDTKELTVTTQLGNFTYIPSLASFIIRTAILLYKKDIEINNYLNTQQRIVNCSGNKTYSRYTVATLIQDYMLFKGIKQANKPITPTNEYNKELNVHEIPKGIYCSDFDKALYLALDNMIESYLSKNKEIYFYPSELSISNFISYSTYKDGDLFLGE